MSTGWIIAIAVIGCVFAVLICVIMYSALMVSGKVEKMDKLHTRQSEKENTDKTGEDKE